MENGGKQYNYVPGRWFWFHWINVVCILLLVFLAFVMMFRGEIGMPSFETKQGLKKLHSWVGYIFILNLGYRLFWSLARDPARFWKRCRDSVSLYAGLIRPANREKGRGLSIIGPKSYSRLVIITLFLLMGSSIVSGLYRAGSDLYYPPLGGLIRQFVVKPGDDPDNLVPRHWKQRGNYVDQNRQRYVDAGAKVMGMIHRYSGYAIMGLAIAHMLLISRMFRRRARVNRSAGDNARQPE